MYIYITCIHTNMYTYEEVHMHTYNLAAIRAHTTLLPYAPIQPCCHTHQYNLAAIRTHTILLPYAPIQSCCHTHPYNLAVIHTPEYAYKYGMNLLVYVSTHQIMHACMSSVSLIFDRKNPGYTHTYHTYMHACIKHTHTHNHNRENPEYIHIRTHIIHTYMHA